MTVSQWPEVEWRIDDRLVPYPEAIAVMEERVAAIRAGSAPELVWLLEHPPLYTAGTSAREDDLLEPDRFPVYRTGRGGQFTYHGPGQRVAYVMLDLKGRGADVRGYVRDLEDWLIATLARFNVTGERRQGRVGIWV
ncbi:MAG: lipoyl(octanoyl) transferase LipB, partial [Kiloniellales bacterium]